ncbi:MAG: hypothetical protein V8R26_05230 [Clostridia bacterium]
MKIIEKIPFGIDGAVIKVDDLDLEKKLVQHLKYQNGLLHINTHHTKETILKDIVCNVGRTGVITPMAILNQ